jgi:hypothetical protein
VSWGDLPTGAFAGLVATVAWAFLTGIRRRWRLWRDFQWLAGSYSVKERYRDQPEPDDVSITVEKNILAVTFTRIDGSEIHGEIAMNEQLPRSGRGHYSHTDDGWGYWEVQTRNEERELLVLTTFAANTSPRSVDVRGYVWSQTNYRSRRRWGWIRRRSALPSLWRSSARSST